MRSLREAGFVTVNQLLDMHPLYKSGTVCDSPGLVKYLSTSIAKTEIQRFENVASKAKDETAQAIKAMEAAIAKEAHSRSVAMEAIAVVDQLEEKAVAQQAEIDELRTKIKADEAKYLVESANAKLEGNVATLSDAKTLETVHEGVLISGSLCTVLVMSDKRELKMKTLTFDKDGSITRKAISYIGKRVKTTCWDPIGQPGKWSSKGYFRNVFLTE
jgi:lipopolysaccharide assembly outer membrane protein LptD (OstA)